MLENKIRPATRMKRRGLLPEGVILFHDNACPYMAQLTKEKLHKLRWEILPHPLYSPDLAPPDFHLFGCLKEDLRGKHFQSNEEVKNQVQKWLRDQPKEFYAKGIYKLAERWEQYISVGGDYVEN
uniref:Tc1-like transposase DDE domain-containing protein n=1 Tax=Graphocephala atropunctata TaxID=36148 RepID=A0A1B6KN91_9HEMI